MPRRKTTKAALAVGVRAVPARSKIVIDLCAEEDVDDFSELSQDASSSASSVQFVVPSGKTIPTEPVSDNAERNPEKEEPFPSKSNMSTGDLLSKRTLRNKGRAKKSDIDHRPKGGKIQTKLDSMLVKTTPAPYPKTSPHSTPKKQPPTPHKKLETNPVGEPHCEVVIAAKTHHITTPELPEKTLPRTKGAGKPGTISGYFHVVRKSQRHQDKLEKEAEELKLHRKILDGIEDDGIQVKVFANKGRGLVAARPFRKNEYVVEYAGDLIDDEEARKREAKYSQEPEKYGCYMYYFVHKGIKYCVDATAETGRYGRLLNHSRTLANLHTEVVELEVDQKTKNVEPRLILRAKRDIKEGEEFLYDYGDRSPAAYITFPWLKD